MGKVLEQFIVRVQVGYPQGPLAPEFRAIVTPFFAEPAVVQHFDVLAAS